MNTKIALSAALCAMLPSFAAAETLGGLGFADAIRHSSAMTAQDDFTIVGKDALMELAARNDDGTIRAIVEIPTGTSAKWEVSKENPNAVYWEYKNDAPRIVNYLGYPGNYGSIPGTALPKELGGDGDPLDVIILGQAAPRGEIVDVRLIGVLKMLDGGEQDDKLIAVMTENSPFAAIESMAQLDEVYPGVSEIIGLWFANYKGPDGGMESQGFAEKDVAMSVFEAAAAQYEAK
ncbi:inorganic diphosphatase [Xinfangfangia sp. CPCC 101601]|uniref:inorganic diphosphatase n=1 Tax=Pseudogemmobacter lacusdianii TaxID=3069608 RepID=A0ABU0VUZ9_9RHOB|nr:inorganic diphosphatase [Xinfangfangia sp. CPCC 101601]MDQ2065556.1 inorganic diphosphatase [Xinfangfangia sp. CPCC 101601]